jgi:uncharacterized protein (UPF0548 family)
MAIWRFGTQWSEAILQANLAALSALGVNFRTPLAQMTRENGWTVDGTEERLGSETPGPPEPNGPFARARQGLINYDFSDPRIVVSHFDPQAPFVGRNMLLEFKVLGFRFLNGVRVQEVRDESSPDVTTFGFRYDTLEGHIEKGFEWFLLTKQHASGELGFKIEAHWRLGDFPNAWSRLGFRLFGEHYRALWRRRAPERLRQLIQRREEKPAARPGELAHRGDPSPRRSESTEGG